MGGMLDDWGKRVCAWQDANFDNVTLLVQGLVLAGEAGEVTQCLAKTHLGIQPDTREDLGKELADVVIVAAGIAVRAGIDLEEAVRAKIEVATSRAYAKCKHVNVSWALDRYRCDCGEDMGLDY